MSKFEDFYGSCFSVFGMNMKIYRLIISFQLKYGTMRIRKNPKLEHFSRNKYQANFQISWNFLVSKNCGKPPWIPEQKTLCLKFFCFTSFAERKVCRIFSMIKKISESNFFKSKITVKLHIFFSIYSLKTLFFVCLFSFIVIFYHPNNTDKCKSASVRVIGIHLVL